MPLRILNCITTSILRCKSFVLKFFKCHDTIELATSQEQALEEDMTSFDTNKVLSGEEAGDFEGAGRFPCNPTTKRLLYCYLQRRFKACGKIRQFCSEDEQGPHEFYDNIVDALLIIRKFHAVEDRQATNSASLDWTVFEKRLTADDILNFTTELHNDLFGDNAEYDFIWPTIVTIMDVLVKIVDMTYDRHGAPGYQLLVNEFANWFEEEEIKAWCLTINGWVDQQGGWVAAIEEARLIKERFKSTPGSNPCTPARETPMNQRPGTAAHRQSPGRNDWTDHGQSPRREQEMTWGLNNMRPKAVICGQSPQRENTSIRGQSPQRQNASILGLSPQRENTSIRGQSPQRQNAAIRGLNPQRQDAAIRGLSPQRQDASIRGQSPQRQDAAVRGQSPQRQDAAIRGQRLQRQDAAVRGQSPQREDAAICGQSPQRKNAAIRGQSPQRENAAIRGQSPQRQAAAIRGQSPQKENAAIHVQSPGRQPNNLTYGTAQCDISTKILLYHYLQLRFETDEKYSGKFRQICPENANSNKIYEEIANSLVAMEKFYGAEKGECSPLANVSWECLKTNLTADAVFDFSVQLHNSLFMRDGEISWLKIFQILEVLVTVVDGLYDKYGPSGCDLLVVYFANWIEEEISYTSGRTIQNWVDAHGGWISAIELASALGETRRKLNTASTPCSSVRSTGRGEGSQQTVKRCLNGFGDKTTAKLPSNPSTKRLLYCYLYHRFNTDSSYSPEFAQKIPESTEGPSTAYDELMQALSFMRLYYAESGLSKNDATALQPGVKSWSPNTRDALKVLDNLDRSLCDGESITWKIIIKVLECLVAAGAAAVKNKKEQELVHLLDMFEKWLTRTEASDDWGSVEDWVNKRGGWVSAIQEVKCLKEQPKIKPTLKALPEIVKVCSKKSGDKYSAYQRKDKCTDCDRLKPISLSRTAQCACGLHLCMFPDCNTLDKSKKFVEHHALKFHPRIWRTRNVLKDCVCGYPKRRDKSGWLAKEYFQCPNNHCLVFFCAEAKCDFESFAQNRVMAHFRNTHMGQCMNAVRHCACCGNGPKPRGASIVYEKCICGTYWCLLFSCSKEFDELPALQRHQSAEHGI